jgi:hypothetical protein
VFAHQPWKLNAVTSLKMSSTTQTGRFQLIDHKCCFLATLFSHNCRNALVAFAFLGYNIYLNGENMIKPGTLCMIRGVPPQATGHDCNGKIVVAESRIFDDVWEIMPHVVTATAEGLRRLIASQGRYLHPLDNPPEDALDTHSTRKELA